jgi:ADP-dependent NAD(P)H-hydrate dehydratase
METPSSSAHCIHLDAAALRGWPLPMPDEQGDKEVRGHVLVLGGSREMPGAVILAATAALRAGAGKLTVATGDSVAKLVAMAMPEARVLGLRENDSGGFAVDAIDKLDPVADKVDAVLVGPGMQDEAATARLVGILLERLAGSKASVVLDANAMGIVRQDDFRFAQQVILTPHAGEMAHLTGASKDAILTDPDRHASEAAKRWNAVLALKGARTLICSADGQRWQHEGGNVGLASSGSGDTLAGIIAGLCARGANLPQAVCWGVALHAGAGEVLAARMGLLGYLAREIPAEIPALLERFASRSETLV